MVYNGCLFLLLHGFFSSLMCFHCYLTSFVVRVARFRFPLASQCAILIFRLSLSDSSCFFLFHYSLFVSSSSFISFVCRCVYAPHVLYGLYLCTLPMIDFPSDSRATRRHRIYGTRRAVSVGSTLPTNTVITCRRRSALPRLGALARCGLWL